MRALFKIVSSHEQRLEEEKKLEAERIKREQRFLKRQALTNPDGLAPTMVINTEGNQTEQMQTSTVEEVSQKAVAVVMTKPPFVTKRTPKKQSPKKSLSVPKSFTIQVFKS
jgi:hypothetical protein